MSWLTTIWSMAAAACAVSALISFDVWVRNYRLTPHLLFSMTALGAAACGMIELMLLHAQTIVQYERLLRWQHVPLFVLPWVIVVLVLG
jgi:hypothetical protein